MTDLKTIMKSAYDAQVRGKGSITDVIAAFNQAATDPAFLAEAQEWFARCDAIRKAGNGGQVQCFVSKQHADFLDKVL